MKAGILTFHQTSNYGATLQAYALWKLIRARGFETEIIDYRPLGSSLEYCKGMLRSRRPFSRIAQYRKLNRFLRSSAAVSPQTFRTRPSLRRASRTYDLIVAGSDEIWNLEKPFIGFDPSYFLDFVSTGHQVKASYAPSFGTTARLGDLANPVAQLLAGFDFLSVRDSSSAALVESCGRKAEEVLDPTLLTAFPELELERPTQRPYLLLYTYRLSENERRFIRRAAQEKNLCVISVGNFEPCADVNLVDASVEEWVTFFKHAAYVMTSYFHGTVFSVIYRKPFNVFVKPNKAVKTHDLLDKLGLRERVFNSGHHEGRYSEIDYEAVVRRLEPGLEGSRRYLETVLAAAERRKETAPSDSTVKRPEPDWGAIPATCPGAAKGIDPHF